MGLSKPYEMPANFKSLYKRMQLTWNITINTSFVSGLLILEQPRSAIGVRQGPPPLPPTGIRETSGSNHDYLGEGVVRVGERERGLLMRRLGRTEKPQGLG